MFTLLRRKQDAAEPDINVNIWALRRDPLIKKMLLNLRDRLGPDAFVIDQTSRGSYQSIYIEHPTLWSVKAYVYIYGQTPGHYGVHLEYMPDTLDSIQYDVFENIAFSRLVDLLIIHLGVSPTGT